MEPRVVMEDVGGLRMGRYLRSRTDLVAPERSPIRTLLWVAVLLVGGYVAYLAVAHPEAFVRGGRQGPGVRGGLAMFVVPTVFIGVGAIGLIRWSTRWRVPGGGKLRSAVSHPFTATDPAEVWSMLESATSMTDPALVELFARIYRDKALPGTYELDIMHSPEDRLLVAMVTRNVQKKPGDPQSGFRGQLEREAVIRRGDAYLDFQAVAKAAQRS